MVFEPGSSDPANTPQAAAVAGWRPSLGGAVVAIGTDATGLFRLLELLDEGAVLHAEFGTHTRTLSGARDIVAQALLSARLAAHSTPVLIGGRPGVAAVVNGRVVSIMAFAIDDDRIASLKVLADPRRLAELDPSSALGRD